MRVRNLLLPLLVTLLVGCPDKEPVVDADNNMDRCYQQGLIEGQKGWHECLERECRESGGTPEQMGGICWNGRKVGPKSSPWLDKDGDRVSDEQDKCPLRRATHQEDVPSEFKGCPCPTVQQWEGKCIWDYCPKSEISRDHETSYHLHSALGESNVRSTL